MRNSNRSGLLVTALVAVGLVTAGCGGDEAAPAKGAAAGPAASSPTVVTPSAAASVSPAPKASTRSGTPKPRKLKSAWDQPVGASGAIRATDVSLVARSRVPRIRIYDSAEGKTPGQSLANPVASGGPLVFLVQERRGDRLRVLLPIRPNESQGWVRAGDVKLSRLDYRITVSARAHELRLYRNGKVVMTEPVGLGKGTTPTPGGVFYLKELLKPRDPGGSYGPYAYGLSGYSDVLEEFLGGDGQIGIHGTNDPNSVGKDVSHGCIRMRNAAITKLARTLPLGVPVQMIA